ncbi:MAG: hypothetical protein RRY97_06440, partial [Oscillibacter sp.]
STEAVINAAKSTARNFFIVELSSFLSNLGTRQYLHIISYTHSFFKGFFAFNREFLQVIANMLAIC